MKEVGIDEHRRNGELDGRQMGGRRKEEGVPQAAARASARAERLGKGG